MLRWRSWKRIVQLEFKQFITWERRLHSLQTCNVIFNDTLTNKSQATSKKMVTSFARHNKFANHNNYIFIDILSVYFYVLYVNTLHPKCIWLHFFLYPNYHRKLICIGPKENWLLFLQFSMTTFVVCNLAFFVVVRHFLHQKIDSIRFFFCRRLNKIHAQPIYWWWGSLFLWSINALV